MRAKRPTTTKYGVSTLVSTIVLLGCVACLFFNLGQQSAVVCPQQQKEAHENTKSLLRTDPPPSGGSSNSQLALEESLGFFDDISDAEWKLLKKKSHDMHVNGGDPRGEGTDYVPAAFYQTFYEPNFACRHEQRIGGIGDGGKWVCDPHRLYKKKDCLVYSVGSEGDFSFEQGIREHIGDHCELHTFDFGYYRSNLTNYHQWGLASKAYTDVKGNKYKTMDETVRELRHVGRTIDIFKIDCEGCEWSTAASWMKAEVTLRQILVELHQVRVPGTMDFFDLLYNNDYVIFHKEPNIQYWNWGGGAIEYAFLKMGKTYRNIV